MLFSTKQHNIFLNMKILYLGTNLPDTDHRVSKFALSMRTVNHGLIESADFIPTDPGLYHTTIVDVWAGGIIKLAKHFDKIVLLDQPKEKWNHWKALLSTYKMMVELEKTGHTVEYKDNKNIQSMRFMSKLLKDNKTFCVYPFMHILEEYGDVRICAKSNVPIKKLEDVKDWKSDPDFVAIRNRMKNGEESHNCQICYNEEKLGFTSTRVHESMDWAVKMDITSLDDLDIELPTFYEVRPSNKCNLQCRMCWPENSHLIAREFEKLDYHYDTAHPYVWGDYEHIQVEKLAPGTRIYSTGGEPTIIPKFYEFLEKCVALGRTDFDIQLTTNGQKVSPKLVKLMKNFDEVNFSFSIDGYDKVNDYIRWNSDWKKTVTNAHTLFDSGFFVSIECVPSLWNITNLHLLYQFIDTEFPETTIFLQQCYWEPDQDMMSIFNHPCPELVVKSMEQVKKTNSYYSDARDNKSIIDTIYNYYTGDPKLDLTALKRFYKFSDMLDKSRGIKMIDYVPELEEGRKALK